MSKFITAEIDLINTKMAELIGSGKHTMKAQVKILTDNIIALREWADEEDDEINPNMCAVYLISGEFFILYKPYAEVVKFLGWY